MGHELNTVDSIWISRKHFFISCVVILEYSWYEFSFNDADIIPRITASKMAASLLTAKLITTNLYTEA